jgi:hypothetical protein
MTQEVQLARVESNASETHVSGAPWRLAVVVSALRCVLTYVIVPVAAPMLGATTTAALPIIVCLHAAGIATSTRALHRGVRSHNDRATLISAALLSVNLLAVAQHL